MTVRHLHALLHKAIGQAEKWGLAARNVVTLVSPPRAPHHEMTTLSEEQTRAFLDVTAGERFEALYVLAVTTGMRQGEILALRWRDVDLDHPSAPLLRRGCHVRRACDPLRTERNVDHGSREVH